MRVDDALALIGIGHIGGSIARGLRAAGAAHAVHGYDADPAARELARELDLADVVHDSPEAAADAADLVVLAVPPAAIAPLCARLAPRLRPAQTVTDVGSVKAAVLADLRRECGAAPPWFVPGHPIAGTEKSGAAEASSGLFRGRYAVLTPTAETDPARVARVRAMWERLGAQVAVLPPERHDALFAGLSHLPHVLSYALIELLAGTLPVADMQRYAAGGLLDFTRIASSSPELWVEICRANRGELLPLLERYRDRLGELAEALRADRADALRGSFAAAKDVRDRLRGGAP